MWCDLQYMQFLFQNMMVTFVLFNTSETLMRYMCGTCVVHVWYTHNRNRNKSVF